MTTGLAALQLLVIDDNEQMRTIVGSQRSVDMLVGEQLPRIC